MSLFLNGQKFYHFFVYLGVHCTHGFNRTGFMIATYLIEILDFDVTSAIAQFAAAR